MEEGETEAQTALREIEEEVGLKVNLLEGFRTTDAYPVPGMEDVVKQVVFFCAAYDHQTLKAQEGEVARALLASYEEALELLEFEGSKRVLREAHEFLNRVQM